MIAVNATFLLGAERVGFGSERKIIINYYWLDLFFYSPNSDAQKKSMNELKEVITVHAEE